MEAPRLCAPHRLGILFNPEQSLGIEKWRRCLWLQNNSVESSKEDTGTKKTKPVSISKDAKEFFNKGLAWDKQGKYDEAIEDFNKAIRLDPNFASAYFYKGLAQYNKGELKTALTDFQRALILDPENSEYKKIVSSLNAKMKQNASPPKDNGS